MTGVLSKKGNDKQEVCQCYVIAQGTPDCKTLGTNWDIIGEKSLCKDRSGLIDVEMREALRCYYKRLLNEENG